MTNPTSTPGDERTTESPCGPSSTADSVRTVLPNGLTVITTELSHLHTAAVSVFAPGGPRHEAEDDNGLSHLVEHAVFRGCRAYPSARDFNEAVEACSLGLGAATCREFVVYDALFRPGRLDEILGLIGAMLTEPTWADLDIEQRIIVEELQDERDESGRDIDVDNVAKLTLMPGCGAGRKIGGDIRRVKRFTTADCERWFRTCYGARNLVLSVAGPLTHEAVVAATEQSLGSLAAGLTIDTPAVVVRPDLPALEYVSHGGSQTSLQLAWLVPSATGADWPALVAAQRLLDDGTSARLRRRVTDDAGLAYHIGSSLEAYTDRGLLVVEADVSHDNVLEVIDAILEEIADLSTLLASDDEWRRIRDRYAFDLDTAIDVAPEVAHRRGLAALYGRDLGDQGRRERFMALKPEDVATVARRHLSPERVQITVVGALDPLDRAGLRRRIHRLRTPATS